MPAGFDFASIFAPGIASVTATPWFAAWQRAAADSMAAAARDPRMLRLSGGLLRAQMLGARACQTAMQSAWATVDAFADAEGSDL